MENRSIVKTRFEPRALRFGRVVRPSPYRRDPIGIARIILNLAAQPCFDAPPLRTDKTVQKQSMDWLLELALLTLRRVTEASKSQIVFVPFPRSGLVCPNLLRRARIDSLRTRAA